MGKEKKRGHSEAQKDQQEPKMRKTSVSFTPSTAGTSSDLEHLTEQSRPTEQSEERDSDQDIEHGSQSETATRGRRRTRGSAERMCTCGTPYSNQDGLCSPFLRLTGIGKHA